MVQLVGLGRGMNPPQRRGASAPVSGAFDAMQALQAAYGFYGVQRLVSSATYTGYAYRAQRSSDNATLDCAPGTTALTLAAWGQAAGAAIIYLTKIYDQSGNALDSDAGTATSVGTAPTLDCSVGVYPVLVFNGTTNRIAFSSLVTANTTATGLTFSGAVQVPTSPAATGAIFCTSQASGNTIRSGLGVTSAPAFQARTVRVDAGSAFGSSSAWNADVNIHTCVIDYPNHIVTGYLNGSSAGATSIGASLPAPAFVNSGGVFIGGMNSSLFTAMRGTCWSLYQQVTSANLAALESAMEAAA